MNRTHFQLHSGPTNGTQTPAEVAVTGEVDAGNVTEFTDAVQQLGGPRALILDLGNVGDFDSAGFAAIDRLLAYREIVLVIAPHSLMAKAAGLMCMPIHPTAAAARQSAHQDTN